MPLASFRIRPLLLSTLLLSACGAPLESTSLPPDETPGQVESAMCAGLSVTSLTLAGASSYGGELGAAGNWAVSTFANGVRLEYYVDGQRQAWSEMASPTGTWNHSSSNIACGTHTLEVRAWPMVIDSNGNRTTCMAQGARVVSTSFSQACPSASMQCYRNNNQQVTCTGYASGGTGSHTPVWQQVNRFNHIPEPYVSMPWYEGYWSHVFYCEAPMYASMEDAQVQIQFRVEDSTGMGSTESSNYFYCKEYSVEQPYLDP
ncbi:hypothetical protein F0U59_31820 [Archangium gephyra]|nr:hypothetical protein F0U59_31820 [Archangium gephyra]